MYPHTQEHGWMGECSHLSCSVLVAKWEKRSTNVWRALHQSDLFLVQMDTDTHSPLRNTLFIWLQPRMQAGSIHVYWLSAFGAVYHAAVKLGWAIDTNRLPACSTWQLKPHKQVTHSWIMGISAPLNKTEKKKHLGNIHFNYTII